jgi:hypothetical protein
MDKPRPERPITTGPIASGLDATKELSISLIKTPGDTNLKLFTDILLSSYNSQMIAQSLIK